MADKEVIKLYYGRQSDSGKACDAIAKVLQENSEEQLLKLFQKRVASEDEVLDFVRAIFFGSSFETQSKLRKRLVGKLLTAINSGEIFDKKAKEAMVFIQSEIDTFPMDAVVETIEVLIKSLEINPSTTAAAFEIFPSLCSLVSKAERVQRTSNSEYESGEGYGKALLGRLLACRWSAPNMINLVSMLREISLNPEQFKALIDKILGLLPSLRDSPQEIPALIYQVLLISQKGLKGEILKGVTDFFDTLESDRDIAEQTESQDPRTDHIRQAAIADEQLRAVEGTVIVYILLAVKRDQELGKKFMKLLKEQQTHLSTFLVAVLLSIAKMQRFESDVLTYIKSAVCASYRDSLKRTTSRWLDILTSQGVAAPVAVDKVLMQVVKSSARGWDDILQSAIQLGTLLMDTLPSQKDSLPAVHQTNRLGLTMLAELFTLHEPLRPKILDLIFSRVLSRSESVGNYVSLLEKLIREGLPLMKDQLAKVKESFDYISYIAPSEAKAVIGALQPLLLESAPLLDHVIIVLRKGLFSREEESRLVAVTGYLQLLKGFKPQSGISSSQQAPALAAVSHDKLWYEIIGNLRRCLTQQASVRKHLYEGLYEALKANPLILDPLAGLLLPQLQRYFDVTSNSGAPLALEKCIDRTSGLEVNVVISEPLAHLLQTVVRSVKAAPKKKDPARSTDNFNALSKHLEKLMDRMSQSELSDFQLDKSADFSDSATGKLNRGRAELFHDVCQAMLEHAVTHGDWDSAHHFFDLMVQVSTKAPVEKGKDGGKRKKGARKKANAKKAKKGGEDAEEDEPEEEEEEENDEPEEERSEAASVASKASRGRPKAGNADKSASHSAGSRSGASLRPECLLELLSHLTTELTTDADQPQREPEKSQKFLAFVIAEVHKHLSQLVKTSSKSATDENATASAKVFRAFGKVLWTTYNNLKDHQDKFVVMMLKSFEICMAWAATHLSTENLVPFLDYVCGPEEEAAAVEDAQQKIAVYMSKFEELIDSELPGGKEKLDKNEKLMATRGGVLVNVIDLLHPCIAAEECKEHFAWIEKMCKYKCATKELVRSMLSLFLKISRAVNRELQTINSIVRHIRSVLGSAAEDTPAPNEWQIYDIVSKENSDAALSLVISNLEGMLEELEWVVTSQMDLESGAQRLTLYGFVFDRLISVGNTLNELAMCAVSGKEADRLVRLLTRLYKFGLTAIKKHEEHTTSLCSKLQPFINLLAGITSQKIYQLFEYFNDNRSKNTSVASVRRESTLKPNLVFAMEKFESFIIRLSKRKKQDFAKHFSKTVARDFYIKWKAILNAEEAASLGSGSKNQNGSDKVVKEENTKKRKEADPEEEEEENKEDEDEKPEKEREAEDEEEGEDKEDEEEEVEEAPAPPPPPPKVPKLSSLAALPKQTAKKAPPKSTASASATTASKHFKK